MTEQWVRRWCMWMSRDPSLPGVWRRRDGGFVVRGRVKDPRTGKRAEIVKALPDAPNPKAALVWLEAEMSKIRLGGDRESEPKPLFCDFAVDLFLRKKTSGDIQSASGREKWDNCLEHLLRAPFAEVFGDKIRFRDLKLWRDELPTLTYQVVRRSRVKTGRFFNPTTKRMKATFELTERVETRHYDTATLNTWLRVLRVIFRAMKQEYELAVNPCDELQLFPEGDTYDEANPNALNEEGELAEFLTKVRELSPRRAVMITLGFCIGHRPSTLRPITRGGADPDLSFNADGTARLRIRRTHSRRQEVMEAGPANKKLTKPIIIDLPKDVADMLQAHIAELEEETITRQSTLLFPSHRHGGMISRTALAKPFQKATQALPQLGKRITPKAMRRSFKDVARAAGIPAVVRKGVSGHSTDLMDDHYATPTRTEKREAVGKVYSLATARRKKGKPRKAVG